MKLTILDRYIGREIILSSAMVIFVLLVIVMSTELVHFLKYLVEGRIPADSLASFMLNSLMEYTITLMPLSLFLGVLLAFGRLYKDSEMTAIMSAGIGPAQWNRSLLVVAVPVSLIVLVLMLYVAPWVSQQHDDIKTEIKARSESSMFSAGQFNTSRSGKDVFFMESNDESGLMNSVFHSANRNGENYVDIAASATSFHDSNENLYTVMHQGYQYIGNAGEANFRRIEYEEYGVLMPAADKPDRFVDNESRTTAELWDETFPPLKAELQWRFTVPIAALISAMIALPLSRTSPRGGRFAKLSLALLVYLVYSNMLGVGKTWLINDSIPFWIGTWWVHIVALVVLALLWMKDGYFVFWSKSK